MQLDEALSIFGPPFLLFHRLIKIFLEEKEEKKGKEKGRTCRIE